MKFSAALTMTATIDRNKTDGMVSRRLVLSCMGGSRREAVLVDTLSEPINPINSRFVAIVKKTIGTLASASVMETMALPRCRGRTARPLCLVNYKKREGLRP